MYKKLALSLLLLLVFVSQGMAADWDFTPATREATSSSQDDYVNGVDSIDYGDKMENSYKFGLGDAYILHCTGSGCPENDLTLELCDKSMNLNHKGSREGRDDEIWGKGNEKIYGSSDYNGNLYGCEIGQNGVTIVNGGTRIGLSPINITPESMDAHEGKYLFVEADSNNDFKIRDLVLTDDKSKFFKGKNGMTQDRAPPGSILIEETDWGGFDTADDYGFYEPISGEIIEKNGLSLSDQTSNVGGGIDYNGGLNDDGEGADDVYNAPLDSNAIQKLGRHNRDCSSDVFYFDSCTPVYEQNSGYTFEGQILVGKKNVEAPPVDEEELPSGERFFICREGYDGEIVATEDGETGLYKCETGGTPTNSWESYSIDDGPGPSPTPTACSSSPPDPALGIYRDFVTIPPGGGYYERKKAVFMDHNASGIYTDNLTGCSYNEIDLTVEKGQPDVFICEYGDAVETTATGDDYVSAQKESYCDIYLENREIPSQYSFPDSCTPGSCKLGDFHNGTALAVKYYVPKDAIPLGSDGWMFKNSSGFDNVQFDSIHHAARDIVPCGEYYSEPWECHEVHNQSMYSRLGIDVGSAYSRAVNDTDASSIQSMWKVSNATAQYTSDITRLAGSEPGLYDNSIGINTSSVFDGGFYPKCSGGQQWADDDEPQSASGWTCSGAIDWTLDAYAFNPTGSQDPDKTGFFVMPWEFRPSILGPNMSYREAKDESPTDSAASIEEIRTVCWQGSSENPDFSGTGGSWFAKEVTGIGSNPQVPVPLVGDIRLGRYDNDYSCRFELKNSQGDVITDEGTLQLVTADSATDEQTRAQKILGGSYSRSSSIRDSWFDETKVCGGCGLAAVPTKSDLKKELISSQVERLRIMWEQNLSYSFNSLSESELSSYLKNGN